ncbi:MAG: hypothetical protein KJO69_11015 [Gammaproteobacteria bacterium]|nr:hypothetical protein [Gammaproteobacteria bacterium]
MKRKKKSCDHRETLGGKGDLRRPEEREKFSEGWDRIFGQRESAQSVKQESTNE